MELQLHLLFFFFFFCACLNTRTEAELQTELELEWRLTDNYFQLCHFLSITASPCLFPRPCGGSLAGAPLSALTLCNQMWHTEGSDDSREDKVTQSPTFNIGYARLLLTGLHTLIHTPTHTGTVSTRAPWLAHIHSCEAELEYFADGAFSRACAISEAITH